MSSLPETKTSTPYSYFNDPAYNTITYNRLVDAYCIMFGSLSAIGNFYIILLFSNFSKLRATQCNWFIVFLCVADMLIGLGTLVRPIWNMISMDNNIMEFNFYWCTLASASWICGYR
uniref:G-protein coupled receptors family 1 profile domain-containing protein n=1 Tax=Acrobeloides nanus TaxID=290746 RepID=A0A914EF10_9BILA